MGVWINDSTEGNDSDQIATPIRDDPGTVPETGPERAEGRNEGIGQLSKKKIFGRRYMATSMNPTQLTLVHPGLGA